MSLKVSLLFMPGWTLATGSPHVALPLLASFLRSHGVDVQIHDLNHKVVQDLNIAVDEASAVEACAVPTLENLNRPYFNVEDRLMSIAQDYGGEWNAQLGFFYDGSPHASSKSSLRKLNDASPFDDIYEDLVQQLLERRPDIVGLGLASVYQIIPALQFCLKLKRAGYGGFIVLGGNTVTRLRAELSRACVFDLVDGFISFQGELPFLQLCKAIEFDSSLGSVAQLTWRDRNGSINYNSQLVSSHPSLFPTPDFSGLPVGEYWGKNYLCVVAARGCYYGRCTFCAIPYGWGPGGFAGVRDPTTVYEDLRDLIEKYGVTRFKFVDEALSPSFMQALADLINRDGLDIEWEGYTRFETAWYDSRFVRTVARAGFRKGYFGLEILPSDQRGFLGKNDRVRVEELLSTCNDAGVKCHLFCMFGYPGTGIPDAERTVNFLLKHANRIDTADLFPWTLAKHTNVPGVDAAVTRDKDWSLEFEHLSSRPDVMSAAEIDETTKSYEEIVWAEAPRLLHPTYRLVSPWS